MKPATFLTPINSFASGSLFSLENTEGTEISFIQREWPAVAIGSVFDREMVTHNHASGLASFASLATNGEKKRVENGASGPPVMANLESRPALSTPSVMEQTAFRLLQSTVYRYLSKIRAVDAVFISTEDDIIHVYTVVFDYNSELTNKLMKTERLIEKDWPGISFEFHTRAHQGREPFSTVPIDSQIVFGRQ